MRGLAGIFDAPPAQRFDAELRIGIGINTGLVIAGTSPDQAS
jgi:class 3 adenylate cyclase